MANQTVFKRYELKYIMTLEQKERLLQAMEEHMALDQYGRVTIRNLYFDTDDYRLIRHSIEKPVYKEKLRVRSYRKAKAEDDVFVELKKKYNHVVYKRRIAMKEKDAMAVNPDSQIGREIQYFMKFYPNLHPVVFLSYEREAYYSKDGSDFRVTFDEHILFRETELTLDSEVYGDSILDEDKVLMEIKCSGGIPLWMTHVLSKEKIYKTSFSKYGTVYQKRIYPRLKEDFKHGRIV